MKTSSVSTAVVTDQRAEPVTRASISGSRLCFVSTIHHPSTIHQSTIHTKAASTSVSLPLVTHLPNMASTAIPETRINPASIGHFGIRTTPDKFEAMVKWHLDFFGGREVLRNAKASFIAWDDEHHRMVIVADPSHEQIANRPTAATVYHIAFTLNSLADLATSYEEKKARGIVPHWPVNHGMSTSMYYSDPDGNEFEMQVNNFATAQEALDFMATPEYAQNPIGVDINIDEFLRRVRSGEDEAAIKKRPVIGQRLSRYENSIYFQAPAKGQ